MTETVPARRRTVIPAVDLGGTKIAFAFVDADDRRGIAREYPPEEVVKVKGRTDAGRTLKRVAGLIRKRAREVEKEGWTVLRLVGMGAPGLYREDGGVVAGTVPNIPGLARIRPARVLERLLGEGWQVFINNDGVVQAIASACAFVRSPGFAGKWAKSVEETGGKLVYFGPGTGFGAGKVLALEEVFHAKNAKSALVLGQARGVVLLAAGLAGVEVCEYAPRRIKQTVAGSGGADKRQVQRMLEAWLGRAPQQLDASDAVAVALCHLHWAGRLEVVAT